MSKIAIVAPPSESTEPNFAMPTIRYCLIGPSTEAPIVSPTAKSPCLALDESITIWCGPEAQRPSVRDIGLSLPAAGSKPKAKVGLPLEPSGLPSRPISFP